MDEGLIVTILTQEYVKQLLDRESFRHSPLSNRDTRDILIDKGHSICILDHKGPCGAAGAVPIWEGVCEVWAALTFDLKQKPLSLVRIMRTMIDALRDNGMHRIQMTILEDDPGLCKWAETLGFTFEGRMLKYGPDKKNHLRYARVF